MLDSEFENNFCFLYVQRQFYINGVVYYIRKVQETI